MAGRPKGSPNKDKLFRDALRMQLAASGTDFQALRDIADGLISRAKTGDVAAIKEVADRLDGKPAQAMQMSGGVAIAWEDILARLK